MGGLNALRETHYRAPTTWNRIPDNIRQIVVELSLEHTELAPSKLSCFYWKRVRYLFRNQAFIVFCTKEVYWKRMEHNFIFAADEFHHKTKFANEMWQTDFLLNLQIVS